MAFNKTASVVIVLTLVIALLVAYGTEARVCTEVNRDFHGSCHSDKNCANDCIRQGLPGGHCVKKRFRKKRCKCFKACGAGKLPVGPPANGGGYEPPANGGYEEPPANGGGGYYEPPAYGGDYPPTDGEDYVRADATVLPQDQQTIV